MVQKTYMAILDFMLVNSFFAWNMSVPEVEGRMKVTRHEFYAALSQEMIKYEDKHLSSEDFGSVAPLNFEPSLSNHHAQSVEISL